MPAAATSPTSPEPRALATTTATGGLLGLRRCGIATALSAATALALPLTGASIGFSIATTALGHRSAGQTVGTRQAIAHVDAVLAIEFHERQAHLGRLDALEHIARHAVGAAIAALLGSLFLQPSEQVISARLTLKTLPFSRRSTSCSRGVSYS